MHAPTAPIRAAFDIESLDIAYVLTATTWHVLDLNAVRQNIPASQWRSSGLIRGVFPMPNATVEAYWNSRLTHASSVPARGGSRLEDIFLGYDAGGLLYQFDLDSRTFHYVLKVSAATIVRNLSSFGPDITRIRSEWFDLDNEAGWVPGNPSIYCPSDAGTVVTATRVGAHSVLLTDTTAHFVDNGYCSRFFGTRPIEQFGPFNRDPAAGLTYAAPPPTSLIGDSFFLPSGLWVLKGGPSR